MKPSPTNSSVNHKLIVSTSTPHEPTFNLNIETALIARQLWTNVVLNFDKIITAPGLLGTLLFHNRKAAITSSFDDAILNQPTVLSGNQIRKEKVES